MIELDNLKDMFSNMRAKTPWNVDGPMLWGYFFTDRSQEKLDKVAAHLAALGYRFVGIHEDDTGMRWLHVERVEAFPSDALCPK